MVSDSVEFCRADWPDLRVCSRYVDTHLIVPHLIVPHLIVLLVYRLMVSDSVEFRRADWPDLRVGGAIIGEP